MPCFSISTLTQKKEKKMKWNKLENNQLQRRLATSAHWATETPGHHLFSSLPREVCHTLHWWLGFFLFWLKQQKVRKKKEKKRGCKEPWLVPLFSCSIDWGPPLLHVSSARGAFAWSASSFFLNILFQFFFCFDHNFNNGAFFLSFFASCRLRCRHRFLARG